MNEQMDMNEQTKEKAYEPPKLWINKRTYEQIN